MTRAELKEHCEKQIEMCEMWAKAKGENPCGKVYEEHKMILELLEQEAALYKIRDEIEQLPTTKFTETHKIYMNVDDFKENVLKIINKYKAEREVYGAK